MKNYKTAEIETQSHSKSKLRLNLSPGFEKPEKTDFLIEQMSKILGKFLIEKNLKSSGGWHTRAVEHIEHLNKLNEQRSN